MVEAAQRTPVSFLQMMCNQKGLTPEYELISVEGVSHEPTFTYKLKVKDILVTAAGLSKKKAKHLAAKNALDQLLANKGSDTDNFKFDDVTITAENLNEFLLEPASDPVPQKSDTKNPVSALQEFCSKNSTYFSHPYYDTVNESGLPHDKIFVEQCIVLRYEVEKFVTLAEGKTKKMAKRNAAEMMMKRLEKYQESVENISVDKDDCSKESKQTEDDENVPHLIADESCSSFPRSDESQQDESNENVTSVPFVESVSPVAKSDVSGLFKHEDSTKDSEPCVKLEELRPYVKEIHIDSD